jgi:hypothetical protein
MGRFFLLLFADIACGVCLDGARLMMMMMMMMIRCCRLRLSLPFCLCSRLRGLSLFWRSSGGIEAKGDKARVLQVSNARWCCGQPLTARLRYA